MWISVLSLVNWKRCLRRQAKNRRMAGLTPTICFYGAVHFYRTFPRDTLSSMGDDIGIARTLEIDYPGRTFVVIPVGRLDPPRGVTRGLIPTFKSSTAL